MTPYRTEIAKTDTTIDWSKYVTLNVILVTYNHSNFIQDALQSILFQKTNFDFDIIVADDHSTDDTLSKIREMEVKSKVPFRYLREQENLGITKNYKRAFQACDAKYIAVLEGDDFWTDPDRLQKHVDFLDHHYECAMSFNRFVRGDRDAVEYAIVPEADSVKSYHLVTARDVAKSNIIGNFSCCVYRKSAIDKLPNKMFDMTAYDWLTNIMVGKTGMIGYLTDIMSFYRLHSAGTWSSNNEIDNLQTTLECIDQYDVFTDYLFKEEFETHRKTIYERKAAIARKPRPVVDFTRSILKSIKELLPPIIVFVIKMIVPAKIWRKIGGNKL